MKVLDDIDESLTTWLLAQPLFFVATAPLETGHVNCSPKGLAGTFAVLGPTQVAYLDLPGSGIETNAHLQENGRIVIMLCAFAGEPRIVRLHGCGRAVLPDEPAFADLLAHFADRPVVRSIIVVDVERVSDSCGYGVPEMAFVADRTDIDEWIERKGHRAIAEFQATHNTTSIDGIPGLAG